MAFGTYDFELFHNPQHELQRLIKQAEVGWMLESKMLEKAGLREGMKTLDLACGPGVISSKMARVVKPAEVLGLDLNKDLIKIANQYKEISGLSNLRFQKANVYDLKLATNDFDFAYARFLYQHLEQPELVAPEVYNGLKPGGIFCILDIDDAWLTIYPEPPRFSEFKEAAALGQKANGGDRYVGRKLAYYLKEAGFKNVSTEVHVISMKDLGIKSFLDITTSFKLEQIKQTEGEFSEEDLKNMYDFSATQAVQGLVGVFVATGTK